MASGDSDLRESQGEDRRLILVSESPIELLPRTVLEWVISGEFLLRIKKKSKDSRAWDQFRLVWDPVNHQEVRGVTSCSVCKSCLRYKMSVEGEEKFLGTKSMLDHMKKCTPSSSSSVQSGSDSNSSSSTQFVQKVPGKKDPG